MADEPRTLLEQLIRESDDSYESVAAAMDKFAAERGIRAGVSARHLQRLARRERTGESAQQGTRRLLRDFFGLPFAELLADPAIPAVPGPRTTGRCSSFGVVSHKFVPAYVGDHVPRLIESLDAEPIDVGWAHGHRAAIQLGELDGELVVFDWGVAVLHLVEQQRPASIAELALWRRRTHHAYRHQLGELLAAVLGEPVISHYVLSCFWLTESPWTGEQLQTAMRLLCMPRALLGIDEHDQADELEHARCIERRLFAEGFAPGGQVDCGVDGVSIGWASWSGVAYHPIDPRAALTEADLVRCELLAQGLWCLCDEVSQQVRAGRDPELPAGFDWRWLRGRRHEITQAGATEPSAVRILRTAVLDTSELSTKLAETVELLKEIA